VIQLNNVTRRYGAIVALDDISLHIAPCEFVAITGPSGCGKSTLMHLIGGLDQPSSGEIVVDGLALHAADDSALTEYRRRRLGIVFQFFHLLPTMTVLENIALPLLLAGEPMSRARPRAEEVLALVGLSDRATHLPHQLSGGQMQRTAIARALIHQPRVLLADEPTGNLDSANAEQVLQLLQKIASQRRTTLLIVTHSHEVARLAARQIALRDGRITQP
jgi:ABC-type lipoprotein export system ATPase subunit